MGALCARLRHLDINGLRWETTAGFLPRNDMIGFAFMKRLPERGVLYRLEESEDGGQGVTEGWGVGGCGPEG